MRADKDITTLDQLEQEIAALNQNVGNTTEKIKEKLSYFKKNMGEIILSSLECKKNDSSQQQTKTSTAKAIFRLLSKVF